MNLSVRVCCEWSLYSIFTLFRKTSKHFLATTAYVEKEYAQIGCSGLWPLKVNCYFHEFYFDFVISKHSECMCYHDVFLPLTALDCGTLNNPTNGQVSHTGRTTFRQTATYSCDTGYYLVGDSNRTCQATGVWSGSEPTCRYVGGSFFVQLVVPIFIIIKYTFRAT